MALTDKEQAERDQLDRLAETLHATAVALIDGQTSPDMLDACADDLKTRVSAWYQQRADRALQRR